MCTPRVQAKIGILSLNNRTWSGTQVVPSKWIKKATTYKCDGNWYYGSTPFFKYGYLFYMGGENTYFTARLGG